MSIYKDYVNLHKVASNPQSLIEAGKLLNLMDKEAEDHSKVGEVVFRFVKRNEKRQIVIVFSLATLAIMHYLFLSQVTGDNFWSLSFVMIILLPLFLLPVWNFFNLLKFRKVLNILSEDARRRTVATNLLLVVIALLPLYTFGKEYAKSSIYQVGTCLELTGSDEDTYYVNPISCFSDKALEQITQSANSAKDCEAKDYETFSTSLGLFCVDFIREPTEQEAEILENRVVGDEKSGL